MKKLFLAIRHQDLETIRSLLDKKPELIACTAKAPPKKDDGQSPLQVALKTGAFEIAELLLDRGADVHFIESEDCCNEWRAPVILDAINLAVHKCRWNTQYGPGVVKVFSTKEDAERALGILERMLEMGADLNARDTFGNDGVWRFAGAANMLLPGTNPATGEVGDTVRVWTEEMAHDLRRVWALMKRYGVDLSYVRPNIGQTVQQFYAGKTAGRFLV